MASPDAPARTALELVDEHRSHTQACRTGGPNARAARAQTLTDELAARGHQLLANALIEERALVNQRIDLTAPDALRQHKNRAHQLRRCQDKVRRLRAALDGA